ncbi:MAG: AzlC family ABC transporter permease [Beijerinckiaceae bacterium]
MNAALPLAMSEAPIRIALRGAREAVGLPTVTIFFSLIGIGGLARDIGYPMLAGVLSSILMWAGPAQVLLFGSIAAGASLPATALAVLFSSLRFLPMVVSLVPLLNEPRRPIWQLLLAAHLVAITNWVEGLRRLPALPASERYPYFCGFGLAVLASGAFATGLGYYLVGALPLAFAACLLFTTPMFFSANLAASARSLSDVLPIGAAIAGMPIATALVGSDYDLMTAGVAGGTLAYGLHRLVRRNRVSA